MSLIQPAEERYEVVADALSGLYADYPDGRFPPLSTPQARRNFLQAFLSYDLIEEFLADPTVEDIIINSTTPIFLHRTGQGLIKTKARFSTNRALSVLVQKLVVFAGRTELDPINDVELDNIRGRVNIIQSPFGPQITITRAKPHPLTILQLIDGGMLTDELAAQLWMYVEGLRIRPANMIIAGGPGSGKTTLLNALLNFLPWHERIVIIEDTLELNTTFLENCSRLESSRRVQTPALVKNSLRMRPERIFVGEVRGEEARDMMTAMSLGKYSISTIHASSARETVLRLQHEPMNVPPVLISLVDVFVILRKLNRDGAISRVVSELVETAGMERQVVLLSPIWSYDRLQEQMIESMPSSAYRDHLATESGWSSVRILDETKRRAAVLKAMRASSAFPDAQTVTRFCQLYSDKPAHALKQLGLPPRFS